MEGRILPNILVTLMCDEEYPKRVAVDLLYKISASFYITNKINMQAIIKDTDLYFKFIDIVIAEWQKPVDSNFIY